MIERKTMEAPVEYVPNFLEKEEADFYFDDLMSIAWMQIPDVPRMEYYCNDTPSPYTYGNGLGRRTYDPQLTPDAVWELRAMLENYLDKKYIFDVCFLNRYDRARHGLGWHADDSPEMDPARPIVTMSLGEARYIEFRNQDQTIHERLMLEHGSIAIMAPGMQQVWEHRIPKAAFMAKPRISLTFRGYLAQ